MKKSLRLFLGLGGLGLLLLILTTFAEHQAVASGSAPVSVVNTPLPVQGSVSVANTPSVNVANTPSVNVANTPTVNLASTSLAVTNPLDNSNQPVPLVVSSPQPYESGCSLDLTQSLGGACGLDPIPAGKKLVIQHVNVDANPQGVRVVVASLGVGWNGTLRDPSFPIADNGTDNNGVLYQAVDQRTVIYMDTSTLRTSPSCDITLTGSASSGKMNCLVSGYLVP